MAKKLDQLEKNYVTCVVLENPHLAYNPVEVQKEILQGRYNLVFPFSATEAKQKFIMSMSEPMSFYMYKRGDLINKIDKIDRKKVDTAKAFFDLLSIVKVELREQ